MTPGAKFYEWERKGVPLRVEIGPKDVANQKIVVVSRVAVGDAPRKEIVDEGVGLVMIPQRLSTIQQGMLEGAIRRREENSYRDVSDYARFREILEGVGGFVYTGWCGSAACEERVKEETKATIRVLPFEEFQTPGGAKRCIACGGEARAEAVWARAY
jgi:prolyl-tRNA synthetase